MSSRRAKRLGQLMKHEISDLIQRGIKNPNIGFATVTAVELTDDLRHAKVFISVYGEEEGKSPTMESLKKASGFIRRELSRRIRLRYFPELMLVWDNSIEKGIRMTELLEKIGDEREGK